MEFDPFSIEFFEDPYGVYAWLLEEAPAYHNERVGFWALSRYDDVVAAHRDFEGYTSTHGLTLDQLTSDDFQGIRTAITSMIMMDPPDHTRMRKLVSRAFTPRRIAEWEPVIHRVITGFLDPLVGSGGFDAVKDFAGPFPVEVICSILGVPEADRQQIRHWTDLTLERELGNPFPTEAGIQASIESSEYYYALIADKRKHPDDKMVSHLIEAEVEREDGSMDRLTDEEIAGFASLMAAAGSETVTKLVGNAVTIFADNPGELAKMLDDPSKTSAAVEEVLRYKAPSQYQGRYSLQDREWHGVTLPAGQPVLLITGAANRDPRAYPDPNRFDIDREVPLGVGLGHGIHYCLGAHLAKLESKIAFQELYARFPDLEVDLDNVGYVHMSNVAGPSSVPVAA